MSVDLSLTKEQFKNGIRVNGFIQDNNKFYNVRSSGGYSTCIKGFPVRSGADVLCNCVGFANGAFNETYVKCKQIENPAFPAKQYFAFNSNANQFIKLAKRMGLTTITSDKIPIAGSMIIWGETANHVAFVSEVIDNDTIVVIQAGYSTPSWSQRNKSNSGWVCDRRTITRNGGGKDQWKYAGSYPRGAKCLGFVLNPAVKDAPIDTPDNYPCKVTKIQQLSRDKLKITGFIGGIENITTDNIIYYKWNSSSVSISNNDGSVRATSGKLFSDRTYEVIIDKPLSANRISVIPYQVNSGYDDYSGKHITQVLTQSIPCVSVSTQGTYRQGIPYIFTEGEWKPCVPVLFINNNWVEIYNNKR